MQTFLPYPSFIESAAVLDRRRLNKQKVEAYQLLTKAVRLKLISLYGITNPAKTKNIVGLGWLHHPAFKMWIGYEKALALYALAICAECRKRGINDHACIAQTIGMYASWFKWTGYPPWLNDEEFHLSHRRSLLHKELDRKETEHYKKLWPDLEPKYGYKWPTEGKP